MIVPHVAILLETRGPQILFDVLRQVDFFDKLNHGLRALRVERPAIDGAENFFDEIFDARSRAVFSAIFHVEFFAHLDALIRSVRLLHIVAELHKPARTLVERSPLLFSHLSLLSDTYLYRIKEGASTIIF